jgi:preprotein translocase subunit SecG
MKYQTLAAGWFISGLLLAYLWQTSSKPLRETRKAKNEEAEKGKPYLRIDKNFEQATG